MMNCLLGWCLKPKRWLMNLRALIWIHHYYSASAVQQESTERRYIISGEPMILVGCATSTTRKETPSTMPMLSEKMLWQATKAES